MNNQLLPLLMFHPLEQTESATIENLALLDMHRTISHFRFHKESFNYLFAGWFVDCMLNGQLKCVVQLWQGYKQFIIIIMEVQCQQGCCIEMQKLWKQLIAVVVDGESSSQVEQNLSWTTCEFLKALLDKTTVLLPTRRECLPTALVISHKLVESKQLN
jgi:hypothetical protein